MVLLVQLVCVSSMLLQATADDVSSVAAASALFSCLLQQPASKADAEEDAAQGAAAAAAAATPLTLEQVAVLQTLLADVWREGTVFPPATAPATEQAANDAAAAEVAGSQEQQQQNEDKQQQQQQELADSLGLPASSCCLSKLHGCWQQLLSCMLAQGHVAAVLAVLDKVAAAAATVAMTAAASAGTPADTQQQPHLVLPISEAEGQQLLDQVKAQASSSSRGGGGGSQLAAVLGLLMPYRCLQERAVAQLVQGEVLVHADGAYSKQLLALLLLRGQLVQLAGTVAAAAAEAGVSGEGPTAAAAAAGQMQAYEMYKLLLGESLTAGAVGASHQHGRHQLGLVVGCLLPHAVAQLCLGSDYTSAAALVAARARVASGMCTLQGALLVLERYLAFVMHSQQQQHQQFGRAAGSAGAGVGLPCCEHWLASTTAAAAHTGHTKLVQALCSNDGQQQGGRAAGSRVSSLD
jgi:hypothetical protein